MWVLISSNIYVTTVFTYVCTSKALKSLQNVAGVYGLVVPCLEVQFPGVVVGHLSGGEPLRAVLSKDMKGRGQRNVEEKESILLQSSDEGHVVHGVGYGVQLTWDAAVGKHIGVLDVRICWHDIVYQAQVDFGRKKQQY
jgi:hypothetical protein